MIMHVIIDFMSKNTTSFLNTYIYNNSVSCKKSFNVRNSSISNNSV